MNQIYFFVSSPFKKHKKEISAKNTTSEKLIFILAQSISTNIKVRIIDDKTATLLLISLLTKKYTKKTFIEFAITGTSLRGVHAIEV